MLFNLSLPTSPCSQTSDAPWQESSDDVQYVEFFSGVSALACAFSQRGYDARAFDITRSRLHDLTTNMGVMLALLSVMDLPSGGMAHFGLVCKSYCWINSGTHKRSVAFPMGDTTLQYVMDGNTVAAVVVSRWLQHVMM